MVQSFRVYFSRVLDKIYSYDFISGFFLVPYRYIVKKKFFLEKESYKVVYWKLPEVVLITTIIDKIL